MEDAELAAIRAARLQQLRQNAGSSSSSSSPTPQGIPGGSSNNEADSAKREAEEQMRRDLLATVLDQKARERLARIALVSPTRSSQIESILLRMAQTGQLRGRVGEEQLISLLEQAEDAQSKAGNKKGAIVYQRRKEIDDEDDDFDFDL
ncbi:DNA-binding TFAR19-related protein [Pyrrhoderma noxium]|uniref:DNA-binding TFAR19-related protein n=1 Tax=Pyrrhoderma noxium TaxID=2282107 RepID=A0A286UUX6_9AGAM|nr:DNA-binding TFAR19-related protein [Pyrrhoderma noxium]